MSATNPFRDPELARPAPNGAGVHVVDDGSMRTFVIEWRTELQGSGWYWANQSQYAWHGPFNTDHAAYDAAVEALS